MKLKLLCDMAGIQYSHNKGDIIEVNDVDAAKRYIENGVAEPFAKSKKETADKKVEINKAVEK